MQRMMSLKCVYVMWCRGSTAVHESKNLGEDSEQEDGGGNLQPGPQAGGRLLGPLWQTLVPPHRHGQHLVSACSPTEYTLFCWQGVEGAQRWGVGAGEHRRAVLEDLMMPLSTSLITGNGDQGRAI